MIHKNLFFLLSFLCFTSMAQEHPFFWHSEENSGRQDHVFFRTSFNLKSSPELAEISLFADSRYLLKVNGFTVGSGPVRFYPEHIFYDTYELKNYLKEGENVIAIHVLSHGMNTFQTPRSVGGFSVWGKVKAGNQLVDLSQKTKWLCRKSVGYQANTPKMTFALGAMEVYNPNLEPDLWYGNSIQKSAWKEPIEVPSVWGKMDPRPIPLLSQKEVVAKDILWMADFADDYRSFSLRFAVTDGNREDYRVSTPLVAFTHIFSPVDTTVNAIMWYGDYFLNGEKLVRGTANSEFKQGFNHAMKLKKGWNAFVANGFTSLSSWEFQLLLPNIPELHLSHSKEGGNVATFLLGKRANKEVVTENMGLNLAVYEEDGIPINPVYGIAWQSLKNLEQVPTNFTKFELNTGKALLVDLGGKKLGRVKIELKAPKGTHIDLAYTEDLHNNRAFVLKRDLIYLGSRFIATGEKQTIETFHPYGLKYLQIHFHGSENGKVKVGKVAVIEEMYPFEKIGSYACSDPTFNAIWEMGWRTLQVCSEDVYVDTPFRERGVYAGDALPEYALTLATTTDSRLMQHTLQTLRGLFRHLLVQNAEPRKDGFFGNLEDYPHLMLQGLDWYTQRTQDSTLMKEMYPEWSYFLKSRLEKIKPNGLYTNIDRAFIEWTTLEKTDAELTAIHIFMAESCRIIAKWAGTYGNQEEEKYFKEKQELLTQSIQKNFWDSTLKTYHDGYKNGKKLGTAFPISGALALLYNVCKEEEKEGILSYIEQELEDIGSESRKQKTSTYGSFYILQTLYNHGMAETAEKFMYKHWSPMVLEMDDTAWENFDNVGIGTLSHAWSAHPTYFFSTEILGVPMEYAQGRDVHEEIVIAPQSHFLEWAKGTVPHPKGNIDVSWEVKGRVLEITVNAPKDLKYTVKPRGRLAEYTLVLK